MKKIDRPYLNPRHCVLCPTGHKGGPVIDTLVDHAIPPVGRIYLCLEHAKRIAVCAGYGEGDEMDRLKRAAELLDQAQAQNARDEQRVAEYRERLNAAHAALAEMEQERDEAHGRAMQAEEKLSELARGAAETVAAVTR